MKKILGLLMMLLSLQLYAGTVNMNVEADDVTDVKLDKGDADKTDKHPRTFIPITCVYMDGTVQLSLLGEIGEFTLTVTNQMTGEQWSAENALILQTSTASGIYCVQIETEDGTMYYGTYTL